MKKTRRLRMAIRERHDLLKSIAKRDVALFCIGFLFPFVMLFCVLEVPASTIETDDEELLASLDAAREAWLQDVSFYGNYTFRRKVFYSEEEAHSKDIEDRYVVAKGFICKLRDKYRMRSLFIKEPRVIGEAGGIVEGRSIDTIANKNFHTHFYPEQGADFPDFGSLNKMSAYTISNVIPDLHSFQTPFTFFLNPITKMPKNVSQDPKYTVTLLEEGQKLLSFSGKNASGRRYIKEIVFKTNEKIPVIEQWTQHRFENEGDNKPVQSGTARVLEWRTCDGISVPSHIRAVFGPLKPMDSDQDTWIVSEWRSDDLGVRPPTDKDFVLQLPPNVGLTGMNHYPKGGLVDIDAITDDDFLPEDSTYYGQETWERIDIQPPNRNFVFRLILAIVGIILIIWALASMYAMREK